MAEGIKVIKVELPYFDEIEVIPIADVHIGDEWTNKQKAHNCVGVG